MSAELNFMAGGGEIEMGRRIRALDWSNTPLGAPEGWPQSLRSALSILLPSKAQIALCWGEDFITLYNDAYRPVFGAKHPQALGKPIREAWDELWRAGLKELFDGVVSTGEAFWARDRPFFMERHGYLEETYFDVSYDPVRDESGRVGGLFCIVSETTGRVIGERRLRTLRDLAKIAQEARSVDEVYCATTRVLAISAEDVPFALFYGAGHEDAGARRLGAAGLALPHPAAPESMPAGEGGWPLGAELVVLEGDAIPFGPIAAGSWAETIHQVAVVPFVAPGHSPLGHMVAGINTRRRIDEDYRDFLRLIASNVASALASARTSEDERRRAESLAELDRAKTAFFSNVSHEFRTPLTLMLGPIEDALEDPQAPLPLQQRERLQFARRSGLRLQKLVNTLLDFSRIEAGRARVRFEPTDLATLVEDLASTFRSAIEKAGLRLRVECERLDEPAWVDRDMWEKIVLNLLSNAFKFTFAGEIEVRLRELGAEIELSVRDTGSGIPAAELEHVFDRFHRVEGARSRTHEGSGIGLALVQELVKLHGGSVGVESTQGMGSTFTVRIPAGRSHLPAERVAEALPSATAPMAQAFVEEALRWLPGDEAAASATALPLPSPGAGNARRRIVWADDNADMRDYVRRLLGDAYEVTAVGDGVAALEAARRRRPDLVLSDVMMPGLDGHGLVSALRADPDTRDIPVVLLSARAGAEARIEGLASGADDYLEKPFTARELLARVAARLDIGAAQAALRASEQRHRLLAEVLRQGVVHQDAQGRVIAMNPAAERILGGAPERLLGREPQAHTPSRILDSGAPFPDAIHPAALALRTGERQHGVIMGLREPSGDTTTWLSIDAVPVHGGGDGLPSGVYVVFEDITERRRADAALRQAHDNLRRVIDSITDGLAVLDRDWRYTFFSAQGARLVGMNRDELVGRCIWDVFPKALGTPFHEGCLRAVRTGQAVHVEVFYPEPLDKWYECHCYPSEQGLSIYFHDITDRKQAQAALEEADRSKDRFIATLAHELRNPLAPIGNAASVLKRRMMPNAELAWCPDVIERQVAQMSRLLDDLLDVSRITSGKLTLRLARLRLQNVIERALEIARPGIEAAGHVLAVTSAPAPAFVNGDLTRLAQLFSNLLNNAAKYTPPGGRISITQRCEAGHVHVDIDDTGIGIDAEHIPRIFEMFSQVESTLEHAQGGLGIGLSLVKGLVELHGGSIGVHSEGPGKGCVFSVRLPLASETAQERDGSPPRPADREPVLARRVLIADDLRDGAESLAALLRLSGHEVHIAFDGAEALRLAEAVRPEVALLDLGMPGLSGHDVCRRIRALPWGRDVFLIAQTGWGQEDDRLRTRDAGFDLHLTKPLDPSALEDALRRLTSTPR